MQSASGMGGTHLAGLEAAGGWWQQKGLPGREWETERVQKEKDEDDETGGRPESEACLLCPIVRSGVSAPAAEMLTAGSSAAALIGRSQ